MASHVLFLLFLVQLCHLHANDDVVPFSPVSHMTAELEQVTPQTYETCPKALLCLNNMDNDTAPTTRSTTLDASCCAYSCSASSKCCVENIRSTHSLKCKPFTLNQDEDQHRQGVLLVDECSETFQGPMNTIENCINPSKDDLFQHLPVYSNVTQLHYLNVFCARCNHLNDTDILYWEVNVAHSVNTLDDLVGLATWKMVFLSLDTFTFFSITLAAVNGSQGSLRPCVYGAVDRCPIGRNNFDALCRAVDLPVEYTDTRGAPQIYANVYCMMCQGLSVDNQSCADMKRTDPTDYDMNTEVELNNEVMGHLNIFERSGNWPISAWNTFEIRLLYDNLKVPQCGPMAIMDPFTNICRTIICPQGSQQSGSHCVPLFDKIFKATYVMQLKISPWLPEIMELDNITKISILDRVLGTLLTNSKGDKGPFAAEYMLISENKESQYVFVILRISVNTNDTQDDVYSYLLFETHMYNHGMHINGSIPGTDTFLKIDMASGVLVEKNVYFTDYFAVTDQKDGTILTHVFEEEKFLSKRFPKTKKFIILDRLHFCHQVVLQEDEVYDHGDSISTKLRRKLFLEGDFKRVHGEIRMCLKDYLEQPIAKKSTIEEESNAPAILSLVCTVLSITGLLVVIVTYILFAELRSIPGKNNMMLALHLLISQCLYQFGIDQTEYPRLCVALGILIHLFWLTAIFWMNACTLHMFRTFVTGQSYRSVRAFDQQVCLYAAYCYGVSMSLVATNIGISTYTTNGESIGYGGRICYISNPSMIGWLFALPVGLVIIVNMGFFLAVVYQISVSTMAGRSKSSDRANAVIYMKLSSLTGVTWVFGYLYLWTNFRPFEYAFIVLNAGQGVLIFISFICTSRIARLYLAILRK